MAETPKDPNRGTGNAKERLLASKADRLAEKNRNPVKDEMAARTLMRQKAATALAAIDTRNAAKENGGTVGTGGRSSGGAILGQQGEMHITDDLKDLPAGCKFIISNNESGGIQFDLVLPDGKEQTEFLVEAALKARIWADKRKPQGYAHTVSFVTLGQDHYPSLRLTGGEAEVIDFMNELKLAGKGPLITHKPGFHPTDAVLKKIMEVKGVGGVAR
jgi:hypothetical protein